MNELIDTVEMYLRTLVELDEEGIAPIRARIAERLGHRGPTVSETVSRMRRDGLLYFGNEHRLELTAEGGRRARAIMRKHRVAERLLVDVVGLPWELAHGEACRLEHVMGDAVESLVMELLDFPTTSPYGNPIPAEVEPPGAVVDDDRAPRVPLPLIGARGGGTALIEWIAEPLQQDPQTLVYIRDAELMPETIVEVRPYDDGITLDVGNGHFDAEPCVLDGIYCTPLDVDARDPASALTQCGCALPVHPRTAC
ncbi:metal-dependent transcriptional regulator [Rhodococcus sp. ACT016]|uniref:metal-dependent transcriptional regulator n=1 Tax=Rhodococcus sp. ACT016 TaxID=3134808 RepID=UPI003D29854C